LNKSYNERLEIKTEKDQLITTVPVSCGCQTPSYNLVGWTLRLHCWGSNIKLWPYSKIKKVHVVVIIVGAVIMKWLW